MKYFESVKISALFIGTIIGAGFMSGKEITVFFKDCGALSIAFSGIVCAFSIYIFLSLGKIADGDIIQFIFKKRSNIAYLITYFAYFIVYATMLAGTHEVAYSVLKIPFAGLLLAVIAYFIMLKNGLKILNIIAIPFLLAVTAAIYFLSENSAFSGKFAITMPAMYLMMNMLLGGHTISFYGYKLDKHQILLSSVLSGIMFFALVFVVYYCAHGYSDFSMPLLEASKTADMPVWATAAILVAILTTMCSALAMILNKRKKPLDFLAVTTFAYLLSQAGFSVLVTYLYPVVSYLGVAFFALAALTFFLERRKLSAFKKRKNGNPCRNSQTS